MAKDFFRDIGTSIFKPVGDFISGGVTALQPGRVQQMQLERKKIEALLKSEEGQQLRSKAQAAWYDRDKGVDPIESAGKLALAIQRMEEAGFFEDDPGLQTILSNRVKELVGEGKSLPKASGGSDFVGPPAPARSDFVGPPAPAGKTPTSKSAAEYLAPGQGELDVFEALGKEKKYEAPTEWLKTKEVPEVLSEIGDYFQASTDTVREENIPKTYPQLGIENIDDQATLQEMQEALPDVDMKSEYEADPEMMKKLIELWKAKKLTKQNLHKAFSMIQQSAQQSLGIG